MYLYISEFSLSIDWQTIAYAFALGTIIVIAVVIERADWHKKHTKK